MSVELKLIREPEYNSPLNAAKFPTEAPVAHPEGALLPARMMLLDTMDSLDYIV